MTHKFTQQELAYYKIINNYFNLCSVAEINKIVNIIEGNTSEKGISLRIIDWFVTNFSKYRALIKLPFDLRIKYKAQLKTYNKKYFDPFKRTQKEHDKFEYLFVNSNQIIITTIGQLNFFKWASEYGIITYIEDNFEFLKKEMKDYKQKELEYKKQSTSNSNSSSKAIPGIVLSADSKYSRDSSDYSLTRCDDYGNLYML
jgi:hypothetical protein